MKTKIVLVLVLCLSLLLSACGGGAPEATQPPVSSQNNASDNVPVVEEATEAAVEMAPEPTIAPFLDEGKVLLDNEYITITLESEVEESYYVGYKLVLENKCDQYILVSTENTSVDGYMVYLNLQNSTVNPGKKAKAELQVYTSDENAMVKSLANLKNVEGVFRLSFNSDGGNSYSGSNDVYPFSIEGRQGEAMATSEVFNQVLVDNDMLRITLGETFDYDYAIGYKLLLENKSDEYLLVSTDNTSVDGFMVYLHMQNATVAPGKTSVAELTAYPDNGDIGSLDEFVNVEGTFSISSNTDGSGVYHGTNTTYPFAFIDAQTLGDNQPAVSEPATKTDVEPVEEVAEGSPAPKMLVLGETISCDDFDFTVNNVELTYELKPRNTSSAYTSYPAEDGKVYIHIDGEYMNKSKKDVCIRDLPTPSADYNDGFCYDGFVIVDDGDNRFDWVSSYVVAEPLTTCHYHGLIECPVIVDETGDPLFVTIDLNGTTYRYDIR